MKKIVEIDIPYSTLFAKVCFILHVKCKFTYQYTLIID